MKKVINGLACAAFVLSLAACKNDKPTTNDNSMATSNPSTSAAATEPAMPAATSTAPATTPAATATASTAAKTAAATTPLKVTPSAANTTPSAPSPVEKANGKTTSVKFDEMTYDWGTVKEGEKMTHIFKFKNTGTNDLVISDAHGSCGCTVPEWPKEPIKPGKSNEIKVVFDSKGKAGDAVQKSVTITANTEPSSMVLNIKGKVTPKEDAKK